MRVVDLRVKTTVAYNLRLPGQVFDGQAGLHQNYFRDYDPATGRYVESDPIGLTGCINTFAYADGNPISNADPDGKQVALTAPVVAGGIVVGAICAAIPSCRDAAVNAAKVIVNACSAVPHEREEDKNCEALYRAPFKHVLR
jgi:RHS repeat-associated protein